VEIKTYFNRVFLSCKPYIKVCIEFVDDNGAYRGMFASIYNKESDKTQVQKYVYNQSNARNYKANIAGRNPAILSFEDFMKSINTLNAEEKKGFDACIIELKRAMMAYLKCDISLNDVEKHFINVEIAEICQKYRHSSTNFVSNPTENVSPKKVEKWVDISLDNFNNDDLLSITQMLSKGFNPNVGITYNGKQYRCIDNGNGLILQTLNNGDCLIDNNNVKDEKSTPAYVRKTIQMVKMKNADGLTEFINGNFYVMITNQFFNGKEFVILENADGEYRTVDMKRVERVTVYVEPPIKETETSL
jgi:hypothetical protein